MKNGGFEISNDELKERASNGDDIAVMALEYRTRGTVSLLDDLRAHAKSH